ncbi:RNA polymerase II-associated protein 1 [Nomia melanderi]|uniref:RNA polymerase II-associated protein 1 n=1 Tax=Nomia melanderi TaxID=2448451 RepID=UPI001304399C|nr:RNA polymerase II-associated protein 1 [Nomia melanderi]
MDRTPILKRPKPTDSEEELFRMQEEFLKNKQQPSAKVINLRGSAKSFDSATSTGSSRNESGTGKTRSKYSELKKLKTHNRVSTSQTSGDVINPIVNERIQNNLNIGSQESVQNIPVAPSNIVLGNIIEKKFNPINYIFNKRESLFDSTKGFPEVFVSKYMESDDNESLFLKQVSSKKETTNKMKNSQGIISSVNEGSVIIEGSWSSEIHKENLEKLSQMTTEDILREKNKLEMALKPEVIQFLKERRNRKLKEEKNEVEIKQFNSLTENQNSNEQMNEEKLITKEISDKHDVPSKSNDVIQMEVDKSEEVFNVNNTCPSKNNDIVPMQVDEPESIPKAPIELMEQAKEKGWVHMDALEPQKLKWMEEVPAQKIEEPAPNEPYNARFDFSGLLLPYKDESVSLDKGLHHHGEEPERPGYSLQELLQLSRSATQQQRCTALTTLANIIEKSRSGWYDKALQPAPLNALSQKNILLLLRFSLDDTSVAVVTATLQALRAFLYSEADEVCLDRLYGFNNYKEPVLKTPKTDVSDTSDLKDHELAQLDAIAALLRSDILLRIRYILSEMRPPPVGVTSALEILTRLVRHSPITALNVGNTPNLLETIIEFFVPLSTNSLAMVNTINNVYGVPVTAALKFCRVLLCYGGKPISQKLNRLKIVQSILSYISCDAGKESFNLRIESLRLWKLLLLHGEAMDSVTGAQLTLLSQLQLLLSSHNIQTASELSCEYAASLIAVASCLTPLKENISVLLRKWNIQLQSLTNVTWGKTKLISETLLAVGDTSAVKTLSISRSQVFQKLSSTSNLLSECSPATEREPSCLLHLGVLTQDGQLQPIVSEPSCFPFLGTTFSIFTNYSFIEEIQAVLSLPQVYKYLKRLETTDWCLEKSWYTRSELLFLTSIVNAASIIKKKLNNEIMHIIWKIAIKLVSTLPADSSSDIKNMLRSALSEEKLSLEIVANELEKLNLSSNIQDITPNLSRNVATIYEQYVPLNGEWDQAAMPKDWIYLPVIYIYTKCRNAGKCNDEDKSVILTVLSLELILPDLVEKLSQSLRFSRLILVYLCDTIYLNNDVSVLLTRAVSTLLKDHHKKLNFTMELPGLSSFTDLFTAMCEHFCSTSYGDNSFSMTLLVPIAQRHDAHYRKLLWSEHAGVLRYIRLSIEQLVVPLKEYLYPIEKDTSLIESYITALVRGIVRKDWCPVPYTIAIHHSAMYLKQSDKIAMKMRVHLAKIPNKTLATLILNYEPPKL